jgi:hypothetical protein
MELVGGEVASVVCDDVLRYTEAASDAIEELDSCGNPLIGDWYSFYPLSAFVDCDQHISMTS